MKINKAFKFRIYPNQEQQKLINQTFGCVRFVYNHFLNQRNELYKTEQKSTTYVNQAKELTILKQDRQFGYCLFRIIWIFVIPCWFLTDLWKKSI